MGWFSKNDDPPLRGAAAREWRKEYDQRKNGGAKTRRMRGGERQIQDDAGNWLRRNGAGCCGCGRHAQADKPNKKTSNKPVIKKKR